MTARDAATETDPTDEVGTPDDPATTAVDLEKPADAPAEADDPASDAADPADSADDPGFEEPVEDTDETGAATHRRARRHRRAEPAEPAEGARRRRWPLVAVLVLAALFAGAMFALWLVQRPDDMAGLSKPQQSAVDAATQAAVNLQTFRRASFDQDFANALASLTPQFGQEQLAPRKDALQKQLTDGARDATATALSAGLVSSTSTQAVVLVVTNTTQTADNGQSTPFVFSRLQLTLQLTDGKWLVSDLKSVGLS